MAVPVDFEKILVGVSCLFFILVFAAILFCLTDYKLCFKQSSAQKIFHDSVLENVAAVQQDQENLDREKAKISTGSKHSSETSMGIKRNKTHPTCDGISDDTITLDDDNQPKHNSNGLQNGSGIIRTDSSLVVIIPEDTVEISKELVVSGLPENKRKICKVQKHHSSDEINPITV